MKIDQNAFALHCPACGDAAHLDIQAQVWVRLTDDGTDADEAHDGSHHWDDESYYFCTRYASSGRVRDLGSGGAL